MLHGRRTLTASDPITAATWPRIVIGAVISAAVVWLTARAFKL
jgi:hypothetical protein